MSVVNALPLPSEAPSLTEVSRIIQVAQPHPTEANITIVVPYDEQQHWWAVKKVKPAPSIKDQTPFQYCSWHSGEKRNVPLGTPPERRTWIAVPSTYGIWTSNFECYDLCWVEEKKRREELERRYRTMLVALDKLDTTHARIMAAMKSFDAVVAARDDLQKRLEHASARIEARKRPAVVDPTRQARESIVRQDTEQLEKAIAQAEQRWKATLAANPSMVADEAAKKLFINKIHYVSDAITKLAKSQEQLQNWINKSLSGQQRDELTRLTDLVQNLTVQVSNANRGMRSSAQSPFFEVYAAHQEYKAIMDFGFTAQNTHYSVTEQLRKLEENLKLYKEYMHILTEYIPRSEHRQVFASMQAEKEEAARAVAAIAALAKQSVATVSTNSQLGQMYIDEKGNALVQSEIKGLAGPATIIRAQVKAVEQPANAPLEEEFEAYEEYENDRDYVGEDYEKYYSGGKEERSGASQWRKAATRAGAPTARRRK